MVAMEEGLRIISSSTAGYLATTCKQAFREAVLRIVHFRCFDTGRRFVMDAIHMLLRIAGHDLTCRLLKVATCCSSSSNLSEEASSIAELACSWHCIMTMTTASFAGNPSSMQFENEILSSGSMLQGEQQQLSRVLECIRSYVDGANRRKRQGSPVSDGSIVEMEVVEEHQRSSSGHDADADSDHHQQGSSRSPLMLPFMYLRSIGIVPTTAASMATEEHEEEEECRYLSGPLSDPTVGAKQDPVASEVWEHCWRTLKRQRRDSHADMLPMFKPILMHGASFARNMVAVNAFYLQDHIAQAVLRQQQHGSTTQDL